MATDMHKVRVIAVIENMFTMTIMSALIITLYVLGAGNYSLWGLLLLMNINAITTREPKAVEDDVDEITY